MGIDTHSLQLLRYAREKFGDLGDTISLGRMAVLLGPRAAAKWAGTSRGTYAEPMLRQKFGASTVDSIDNSSYEGATIVADFNQPVPDDLAGRYDTVLDFGCTEHVFDVAQSLRNIARLCKSGSRILHAVPSNGFCGHGFYQFSPELFFSWYSADNGFKDTEVFLAEPCDIHHWYRVSPPRDGQRINVRCADELSVLVVTKHERVVPCNAQQSDYLFTWQSTDGTIAPPHAPGKFALVRETLNAWAPTARIASRLDAALAKDGTKSLHRHHALERLRLKSS